MRHFFIHFVQEPAVPSCNLTSVTIETKTGKRKKKKDFKIEDQTESKVGGQERKLHEGRLNVKSKIRT